MTTAEELAGLVDDCHAQCRVVLDRRSERLLADLLREPQLPEDVRGVARQVAQVAGLVRQVPAVDKLPLVDRLAELVLLLARALGV